MSHNHAIQSKSYCCIKKRLLKRIGEEIKTRVDIELDKLDKEIAADDNGIQMTLLETAVGYDEVEIVDVEIDEE